MGKNALVILGAGAAHDLIPLGKDGQPLGSSAPNLVPPLTRAVFEDNIITKGILDQYQGARNLAGTIRIELEKDDAVLEPLLERMAEAEEKTLSQQFPQIPLYLQDLFLNISRQYTNQAINYQRLAFQLFSEESGLEQIAFLTLNYDTILDDVLSPSYLSLTQSMASYANSECLLVKLHGSVNWARTFEFEQSRHESFGRREYLNLIGSLGYRGIGDKLGPDFAEHPPSGQRWTHQDEGNLRTFTIYYPALSVPLGEYNPYYACPSSHVEALKEFLKDCKNVLAIGVSGRDQDLLGLLQDGLPKEVGMFALVDSSLAAANSSLDRFSKVPQLSTWHLRYTDGFSGFILQGGLEEVISGCR
ncbi:MAG: hypothetical protein IH865_03085 [Chloroflexi bacterium]|nr:hypothetical protein [Chloroflexota bacterium]